MNDTPRTDEQINGKPCTRFAILLGDSLRDAPVASEFARTLELELAELEERVKILSAFEKTAPGRLPSDVQSAIWPPAEISHRDRERQPDTSQSTKQP